MIVFITMSIYHKENTYTHHSIKHGKERALHGFLINSRRHKSAKTHRCLEANPSHTSRELGESA